MLYFTPHTRARCADDSDEELDGFKGALYKRKDFLGVEEEGES